MPVATKPTVFERGDRVYIISPISPFSPNDTEVEEFAFAAELRRSAPNEHIKWLRGQYVEADTPNKNGQVWTAGEIAMKSLTPMFMPVTLMHDVRSAVGVIADTRLLTPDADQVPRSRLDNTLAVWAHRFPEVAEEIDANYAAGTLMQSMECMAPQYDCAECGQTFHKLPGGAERANWCAHLKEGGGHAARILGNVVFTGTGLLFGSLGKEGANPKAHLEVAQDEIAESHEKAHREMGRPSGRKPKKVRRHTSMAEIEIDSREYAELQQRPTKEALAAAEERASTAESAKAEAERKLEAEEAAKKTAEDDAKAAKDELKTLKDEKAEADLANERFGKLGAGFVEKLGESTKSNLRRDAGKMEEKAWDERLKEVEEMAGVKRDAKKDDSPTTDDPLADPPASSAGADEFSAEEIASSAAGGLSGDSGGSSTQPSVTQRGGVARGLFGKKPENAS